MDRRGGRSGLEGKGNKSSAAPRYMNNNSAISESEVDTSDAAQFVIDGRQLKEESYHRYLGLVYYCFTCLQKSNLQLFTHPGTGDIDGGLVSHEGEELHKNDYYHLYANSAIDEFNRLSKGLKLRLVELLKVNTAYRCGINLYMTFSAADESSGNTGIYQAALVHFAKGQRNVLGLFRDCCNDKILAILSIIGAEEDLAAYKKQCYGEPIKSDYGVEPSECRDLEHFTALGIGSGNKTMLSS